MSTINGPIDSFGLVFKTLNLIKKKPLKHEFQKFNPLSILNHILTKIPLLFSYKSNPFFYEILGENISNNTKFVNLTYPIFFLKYNPFGQNYPFSFHVFTLSLKKNRLFL